MILQTRLLALERSYRYRDRTTSSIDILETNIYQDRLGTNVRNIQIGLFLCSESPGPRKGIAPPQRRFSRPSSPAAASCVLLRRTLVVSVSLDTACLHFVLRTKSEFAWLCLIALHARPHAGCGASGSRPLRAGAARRRRDGCDAVCHRG
jgi:hypothetical protein